MFKGCKNTKDVYKRDSDSEGSSSSPSSVEQERVLSASERVSATRVPSVTVSEHGSIFIEIKSIGMSQNERFEQRIFENIWSIEKLKDLYWPHISFKLSAIFRSKGLNFLKKWLYMLE